VHSSVNAWTCSMRPSLTRQQSKSVRRVRDSTPCQLGTRCPVTTPTMTTSTGNNVTRSALWFWLVSQLRLGVMSVNSSFMFSFFLVSVVMDYPADSGPPLVLVSSGQGRWQSTYFDNSHPGLPTVLVSTFWEQLAAQGQLYILL
jgi:hypothetical protein